MSVVRLTKSSIAQSKSYEAILQAGKVDGEHIVINLYNYLAIILWTIHGKGQPINYPVNFNSVILLLQGKGIKENTIKQTIKNEIAKLSDDQIVLEPYRNLIKTKGFENFVTVNFDNFLERAFAAEGKKVNRSINFSLTENPDEKCDRALAKIFNLMGNIYAGNFATTDEESLEYLYLLKDQSNNKIIDFFKTLEDKSLLLIGCSFPDWFMRFFIRIVSNERYVVGEREKYVASDKLMQDSDLKSFLECNATTVIPIGNNNDTSDGVQCENSIAFVNEIYKQNAQVMEFMVSEKRYKELVFLSYSRDDQSIVEKLKNEFERNGVQVFFDKDSLKTGGNYDDILIKAIKDCDYFIAIISKNSIGDQNRYVYDTEWSFAITYDFDRDYIKPYIIDDTSPGDEKIHKRLRQKTINKIENFDDFGTVVRKFIQENNLVQINQETSQPSNS